MGVEEKLWQASQLCKSNLKFDEVKLAVDFPPKGGYPVSKFFNAIVGVIINYNSLKNIVYLVTEFAPILAGIRVKQIFNKRTHHYEYGVRKHWPSLLKWIRVLALKRVSSLISLFHIIHGVPPSSCLSFPSCFHVFCPSLVSFGMGPYQI